VRAVAPDRVLVQFDLVAGGGGGAPRQDPHVSGPAREAVTVAAVAQQPGQVRDPGVGVHRSVRVQRRPHPIPAARGAHYRIARPPATPRCTRPAGPAPCETCPEGCGLRLGCLPTRHDQIQPSIDDCDRCPQVVGRPGQQPRAFRKARRGSRRFGGQARYRRWAGHGGGDRRGWAGPSR